MTSTAPHHEPEVLAARNLRTIAEQGLPDGWLTEDQATALLVTNIVDRAAGHAERAFLGAVGLSPRHADNAVTSTIAELFDEVYRAADFLDLAPAERTRLEIGVASTFDCRFATLRAFAIHHPGHA